MCFKVIVDLSKHVGLIEQGGVTCFRRSCMHACIICCRCVTLTQMYAILESRPSELECNVTCLEAYVAEPS